MVQMIQALGIYQSFKRVDSSLCLIEELADAENFRLLNGMPLKQSAKGSLSLLSVRSPCPRP